MLNVEVRKHRDGFSLDVAFRAPTPGLVALFGRSGCGKSTIVNLVAGLLRPDEGTISLNEHALYDSTRNIDVPAEHRRIGYVFQDARLFPHFDVLGNLRYGEKRAKSGEPSSTLDSVVDLLGLAPLLKRRPHQLSGGERQRVAVGRALLCRPRLLLLDEPLASLDLARRDELLPYLEKLRDRLSIPMIYVSHQFDEVLRLATHVVLLENGRVTVSGDLSTVSRKPELRSIVGSDSIGAVIEGEVTSIDDRAGFARLRIGTNEISVTANGLRVNQHVRVQLLARDLILAVEQPRGVSVRNILKGKLKSVVSDDVHTQLIEVDIGGCLVIARVTGEAARELDLREGRSVWVLVKTVSLRGHIFPFQQQV